MAPPAGTGREMMVTVGGCSRLEGCTVVRRLRGRANRRGRGAVRGIDRAPTLPWPLLHRAGAEESLLPSQTERMTARARTSLRVKFRRVRGAATARRPLARCSLEVCSNVRDVICLPPRAKRAAPPPHLRKSAAVKSAERAVRRSAKFRPSFLENRAPRGLRKISRRAESDWFDLARLVHPGKIFRNFFFLGR